MNDPIPITKEEPALSTQEIMELDRVRHQHHIQWAFLAFVGFVMIGFLTPLFIWLGRLALGG